MAMRAKLVTVVGCIGRVAGGLLLGLLPVILVLVNGIVSGAIDADGLRYYIVLAALTGAVLGSVGGLIWAGVFLRSHFRVTKEIRVG